MFLHSCFRVARLCIAVLMIPAVAVSVSLATPETQSTSSERKRMHDHVHDNVIVVSSTIARINLVLFLSGL